MMQRNELDLHKKIVILSSLLLIATLLVLTSLTYANMERICEIYPADPVVESWLQGIARTLK
jgi:hypothetical protein